MMLRNHSISWKSYIVPYLWCDFTSNTIVWLLGSMNTQSNAARRLEEKIANAGDPPKNEQVPPLE